MTGVADDVGGGDDLATVSSKAKVKFLCSHGGKILIRPTDGHLKYVGGETRVIAVARDINFSELMKKLNGTIGGNMVLKYQLLPEDLETLVTVKTDEDLKYMFEEHERHGSEGTPKLRTFLFPAPATVVDSSSSTTTLESHALEQRYFDAINGVANTPTSLIGRTPMNTFEASSSCSSRRSPSPSSRPSMHRVQSYTSSSGRSLSPSSTRPSMHRVQSHTSFSPRSLSPSSTRPSMHRVQSHTSFSTRSLSPSSTRPSMHRVQSHTSFSPRSLSPSSTRPSLHRVQSHASFSPRSLSPTSTRPSMHRVQSSPCVAYHNHTFHQHDATPSSRLPPDLPNCGGMGKLSRPFSSCRAAANPFSRNHSKNRHHRGCRGCSHCAYHDEGVTHVDGRHNGVESCPQSPRDIIWE